MRTILRWMAAVVALVAGLTFGAGAANAAASPDSATVHGTAATTQAGAHLTGGYTPKDWWWD